MGGGSFRVATSLKPWPHSALVKITPQVDAGADLHARVPRVQGRRRGRQGACAFIFLLLLARRNSVCVLPLRSRLHDKQNNQQVIPIYGRGSDFDPRQAEAIKVQPVPPRPAGQRPAPVQVRAFVCFAAANVRRRNAAC